MAPGHGAAADRKEVPTVYKAAVRALMRHSITKLNQGDADLLFQLAHPDFELAFPGDNSWSTMFGPAVRGRERHVTHRGIEQGRAFADRFIAEGLQIHIEDIVVNGPPWNTRIALRFHDFDPAPDGGPDRYNNRAVAFLEIRWGQLLRWEDYEDTERVAAWDRETGRAERDCTFRRPCNRLTPTAGRPCPNRLRRDR